MSTQHYLRQPTVQRLPQLLEEIKSGALRIPPFQREFVWTGEQRLHLFDSVARGLPLGSLMVWRTTMDLPVDPHFGPIELQVPEVSKGSVRQYLLDGRQRITSLFGALGPGLYTREEKEVPQGFGQVPVDDSSWKISFDLERNEFELGEEQSCCLPLSILLDDFALDRWLGKNAAGKREWYKRARALKSSLYDYLIPITPLYTDDLGAVTLTFKRVNRAGTPMGDLEMARALSWTAGGFDISEEIDRLVESLAEYGWSSLDADTVLKVLAAASGQDIAELDVEKLAVSLRDKGRLHVVQKTRAALSQTVQLLNEMGVAGPRVLPWRHVFVAVSRIMIEHPNLTAEEKERLRGWMAVACLTEAFGNAPPHVLRSLHSDLLGSVKNASRTRKWSQARRSRRFGMKWARSRITAVVLAMNTPLRGDGKPMFDRATQAVGQRGNDVMLPLFGAGKGFSEEVRERFKNLPAHVKRSAANRVLCAPEELAGLREAIERCDDAVCASHAAPVRSMDNLVSWLEERDEMLRSLEIEWVKKQKGDLVRWKNESSLGNYRG